MPSSSAKLKATGGATSGAAGSPTSPTDATEGPAPPVPGPEILGRFPPESRQLSESELDPYFINFEASTRELELLLQGNIEKVNRRTLSHLSSLSSDLMELGARYNGFSLSEQSPTVAAAIERVGQAADTSYIGTEELSSQLSAQFAEPMRESAQFASVVRGVLRYRVLKRVQEDMTRDELAKKKTLLDSLERSELEAKRIEQYLNRTGAPSGPTKQRSLSTSSAVSSDGASAAESTAESEFPPTHGEPIPQSPSQPLGHKKSDPTPSASPAHRKSSSGTFVANKLFGRISHAVHGFVDVDPERTRRDQIGKTKESLIQVCGKWGVEGFVGTDHVCSWNKHWKYQKRMSKTLAREFCRISDASRRTRKLISAGTWYARPTRFSTPIPNHCTGRICPLSLRLGAEESRDVDRSQGRGGQDRGEVRSALDCRVSSGRWGEILVSFFWGLFLHHSIVYGTTL